MILPYATSTPKQGGDFMEILVTVPAPIWAFGGIVAGAVIAGLFALLNGRRDTLSKMVVALQSDVRDLRGRVETLEGERNAYRSWAHVLWFHIHDDNSPRIPAPVWPEDLPR